MTIQEKLELSTQYEAALRYAIAIKKKLIEVDAPHRKAIFKVLDDCIKELYGQQYEQERFVDELGEIINGLNF